MAGRYLVTGVQLGMLIGIGDQKDRDTLVRKIMDVQYIGNSKRDILEDVKDLTKEGQDGAE